MNGLWCCIALAALPTPARAAEPDPDAARKLAADAVRAWGVPGGAAVVVRGDDTLLLDGFGVRALGRPEKVTPDTVFPLASCSKAFTTALLAMLVDDGAIGWDDPPRKHFPGFKLSDPHADALLTVRDLLCHRAGLAGHDPLWYRAPWNLDETLERAQLLPLDYPFRAGFRYSSIPFVAAGRVIEKRTGEKWEKLVRTRICEPLGMKGVTFTTTESAKNAERAGGHRLGKAGKVEPMPLYEMREPNPSGSVNATPRDIAAWLKFHLSNGLDANGTRIVSVKNLNETKAPHNPIRTDGLTKVLNPDTTQLSYALAWLVYDHRGKKVVAHGGLIDGVRVQITLLPDENLGLAVFANLHETRLNAALTNSLIDLYCGLPGRDWNAYYRKVVADEVAEKRAALDARDKARDPYKKQSLALAGYAGEYSHPAYRTATVALADSKLKLVYGGFECPLEQFEGDSFRIAGGGGQFEEQLVPFTVANGKATGLTFAGQEFRRK